LLRKISDYLLLKKKEPSRGIGLLRAAINLLVSSPHQLTSLHSNFLCLCLKAKNLKPALPFVMTTINELLKQNSNGPFMDSRSVLLYFYYGGMVLSAIGRFRNALFFFEQCLTMPATALSAIMVEAYKKYILLSILVDEKVRSLPAYRAPLVQRAIKPLCADYVKAAALFAGSSSSSPGIALAYHLRDHMATFQQDNNVALMQGIIQWVHKSNIRKLTRTFVKLSLTDVANRCRLQGGPNEAETFIRSMVERGEIAARIDEATGMVSFEEAGWSATDGELEQALATSSALHALDCDVRVQPVYVSRLAKQALFSVPNFLHDDEGFHGFPQSVFDHPPLS